VELHSQAFGFGRGVAEAIVTHRAQSGGEHMAQVTFYKRASWQRYGLGLIMVGTVFPAEGDRVFIHGQQTLVADGGASHVSTEILYGGTSRASGLDVHSPVFAPHGRIYGPVIVFK